MPAKIDQVNASNQYGAAATIENIYDSNGGFFQVAGNDAFCKLQSGIQGQAVFNDEVHVPQGTGVLYPGTTGVAFRNYVAGSVAVVSAALYYPREPALIVNALGQINSVPVSTTMLTGHISSLGAVVAGSGFAVAAGGTPVTYAVTFTTPYAAAPVVSVVPLADLGGGAGNSWAAYVTGLSAAGFTVHLWDLTLGAQPPGGGTAVDFVFIVEATV